MTRTSLGLTEYGSNGKSQLTATAKYPPVLLDSTRTTSPIALNSAFVGSCTLTRTRDNLGMKAADLNSTPEVLRFSVIAVISTKSSGLTLTKAGSRTENRLSRRRSCCSILLYAEVSCSLAVT